MKIALIFSGLPRLVERSSDNNREKVIRGNDIDVYSYCWKADDYEMLETAYNHKVLEIMDQPNLKDMYGESDANIIPNWYGKQLACRKFKSYVEQNNLHYDLIIKTRHDIYFYNKVKLYELDPEKYNISNAHWNGYLYPIFDDNLIITSPSNYYDWFYNIFDWYINDQERTRWDHAEFKLSEYSFSKECSDIPVKLYYKIRKHRNLDYFLSRYMNWNKWAANRW